MELKVWVEGLQRVVCGVNENTTCQDVVVALASAIGKVGRYTLIEKWRETERLVAPTESPVVILHKWGEYSSDVQFILKYSGDPKSARSSNRSDRSIASNKWYAKGDKMLADLAPRFGSGTNFQRTSGPVRRSLTFSGAHGKSLPGYPQKVNPLGNHNSTSALPSRTCESTKKQNDILGYPGVPPVVSQYASLDRYRSRGRQINGQPQPQPLGNKTQSVQHIAGAGSVGISPPKLSLNSIGRLSSPPRGTSLPTSSEQSSPPSSTISSLSPPSPASPSSTKEFIHVHPPASQPIGGATRPLTPLQQYRPPGSPPIQNRATVMPHQRQSSLPVTAMSPPALPRSSPPRGAQYSVPQSSNSLPTTLPPTVTPNSSSADPKKTLPTDKPLVNQVAAIQRSRKSPSPKAESLTQGKVLRSTLEERGVEVDEVKPEAVQLVNVQLEKLTEQEDQMRKLEMELSFWEQRQTDQTKRLMTAGVDDEIQQLEKREKDIQEDLEELELVSWQDKLEMEKQREQRLLTEIDNMKKQLNQRESRIKYQCAHAEKLETQTNEIRQTASEQHLAILKEMSSLKQQLVDHEADTSSKKSSLEEVQSSLKMLEKTVEDRQLQIADLDRDLKTGNMTQFSHTPSTWQNQGTGSASEVVRDRRPGSARHLTPASASLLREAVPSAANPHGLWV